MAKYTSNYNLEKQESNDYISIDGINGNFDIIDTQVKDAKDKADQAFQSASNGKAAIKAAITGVDPEVTIPTEATFQQLAEAIEQIETGVDTEDATATAGQILGGQTAYVKGDKVTGAMPNRGAVNQSLGINGTYTIPGVYHSGSGIVTQSITTKSAQTFTPGTTNQTITSGQYLTGTQTILGDADLIPANIKSGVDIFGRVGTYEAKSDITGASTANVKYTQSITKGALLTTRRHFGYDTPIKVANPSILPGNVGYDVSFSPDGLYMAVTQSASPYISIYKQSGDTFTKLPNPSTVPPMIPNKVSFSPDGVYLAVAYGSSAGGVSLFTRSGDTFTYSLDVVTNRNASSVSFSPDGAYLAIGIGTVSPSVWIFKKNSSNVFTSSLLTSLAPIASPVMNVCFSNTGGYLTIAYNYNYSFLVYKRSGDTFTQLAVPTANLSLGRDISFSPDDTYMAVCIGSSPYVLIYKRSGDTFTRLPDPAVLPSNSGFGIAFSSDGIYLAIAIGSSPYINLYKRSGDTFTKLPNPAILPAGQATGVEYNNLNSYFAVSHYNSPWISIYKGDVLGDYAYLYTSFNDFYCPNYINFGYAQITAGASETAREIVTIPIK